MTADAPRPDAALVDAPFADAPLADPSARGAHATYALAAALLAGLVPLLAWPRSEIGYIDDFSYSYMAFDVLRTGTYRYDGWTTPAMGPQAYWGAAFAWLLGESFFALRCSVLVLASLTGAIVYRIACVCGLSRPLAFQASVACMLSPIAIPLSSSFMTDVPGLFFGTLGVLLGGHAVRAAGPGRATACFVAMLAVAFTGGLVRQVVWLLLLAVAPLVALVVRQPRAVRAGWLVLWAVFVAITFYSLATLRRQPYAVIDDVAGSLLAVARRPVRFGLYVVSITLTMLALLLPVAVGLWPLARRMRRGVLVATLLLTAAILTLGVAAQGAKHTFEPWLGDVLTPSGPLAPVTDLLGRKPQLIPVGVNLVLAGVAWLSLALLACLAVAHRSAIAAALADVPRAARLAFGTQLGILASFSTFALALSISRSVSSGAFDRYVLVALPTAFVVLLLVRQRRVSRAPSAVSWAAIAVAAVLGLAFSFEYHASLRARKAAADRLISRGIDRRQISAGYEYDGLTQLAATGYLNDPRLVNPPGAYVPYDINPAWRAAGFWLWPRTPSIRPRFLIARDVVAGYARTADDAVPFASWFPPFRRELVILELEPALRDTPHLVPANR